MNQWDQFLAPYKQAVDELKIKLKGLRKQYDVTEQASPIEFVTGRVKPMTSIIDKANKRRIPFDRLHEEMSEIKDEIQEAQKYYSKKRAKKHDNE